MTAAEFRRIALSFPEATEAEHMGHPDFRARGKIFATLTHPNGGHGVVILSPEEQTRRVQDAPEAFSPVPGFWGRRGATRVELRAVTSVTLQAAMEAAWERVAARPPRVVRPARQRARGS